jgi:hypothetical protein
MLLVAGPRNTRKISGPEKLPTTKGGNGKRWVQVPKSVSELKRRAASNPEGRLTQFQEGDKCPKGYVPEVLFKLKKSK